ncbi:MAG: DNA repair protein RadA [Clostridia bacterium]|nr:DNA repair protein RadA [Clostridia bacterium]
MAKIKQVFICTECGYESPKWNGQCPQCKEWSTMEEQTVVQGSKTEIRSSRKVEVKTISEIQTGSEIRFSTGLKELDRVLGGGLVEGSLTLVGGDPGIGKSTLLLQICQYLGQEKKVLYVSGEESMSQIKLRAERLNVLSSNLFLACETNVETILDTCNTNAPDVLIIDSVQTMMSDRVSSAPGTVTQVKECTSAFMRLAKEQGITVFVIGHVNKDGAIAGPKVLEHMVDTVLYFEGDKNLNYRILRTVKNRFGSTNEIGVFDMQSCGLVEIDNPSKMFLEGRPENVPGTCVACLLEGTRPILAEIQALVSKTAAQVPRRMGSGIDYNRLSLLIAVLEKRANLVLYNQDAYVNVVGGFRVFETAADLAIALAVASAFADFEMPGDLAVVGEIGLSGEVRAVSFLEKRIKEAQKLGFTRIMVPSRNKLAHPIEGIEIIRVASVSQAIYKTRNELNK